MFQWGVLSTASIGQEQLIPNIQDSENGVVAAIASRNLDRAKAVAAQFAIPRAYGSYEELLADPAIDGVYIPLPTSQHIEWSIKAIEAGKHVLCEKPIALQADEIAPVITARDKAGVLVSEAYMVTYKPQWLKVRELLRKGAIGRLRQVQGAFSYYNVDPGNMRNVKELGGGGLLDIGVYPTVSTRFATGCEPARVRATIKRDPEFGTDIYADVTADFGDFHLSFYCSTQMAARQFMVFHGDKGFIEITAPFNDYKYGMTEVIVNSASHEEAQTFRFLGVRQYRVEVEAFVRRAMGGDGTVFTLEESVLNQKVIDAIFRAGEKDGWEQV